MTPLSATASLPPVIPSVARTPSGRPAPSVGEADGVEAQLLRDLAAVEAHLPRIKVQNFHFQRQLRATPPLPMNTTRPHLVPFASPPTDVPLRTSCPSSIRPDHFCAPNLGRDWDAARGHRVFPVSYALPEDEYAATVPEKKKKTKDCSVIVPRDKHTYKFTSHAEYVAEYASSFYCITFKKGGWDTLRHYEIIAAGCMPYVVDIEYAPEATMVHFPKHLVYEARRLPGVRFDCRDIRVVIDHAVFPKERYFALLSEVMAHARKHMTTTALARYVLGIAGFTNAELDLPSRSDGGGGPPAAASSMRVARTELRSAAVIRSGAQRWRPRVLVVCNVIKGAPLRAQGNYNTWFLFHGLRTLLGADAVDSHVISFLYEQPLDVMQKQRKQLYGLGFGYAYKLPPLPAVNRTDVGDQLDRGAFDAVIYVDPFAALHRQGRRPWLYERAVKAVSRERIFFLHAPDIPYPNPKTVGYDVRDLYDWGVVLQREVPDCAYYVPPQRDGEAMKRCVWYHNANCFDDVNVAPTVERVPALKARGDYIWQWPERDVEVRGAGDAV